MPAATRPPLRLVPPLPAVRVAEPVDDGEDVLERVTYERERVIVERVRRRTWSQVAAVATVHGPRRAGAVLDARRLGSGSR